MKICSACGYEMEDNAKFCPQCGLKIDNAKTKYTTGKSTVTDTSDDKEDLNDWEKAEAQTLICHQCQTPLQPNDEDWEKGYVICPACGAQRVLSEHKNIQGTVYHKLDNSEQVEAHLNLADRAWCAGDYAEALTYYTKVLEDDPDNIVAMYRKGISDFEENLNESVFRIYFEDANKTLSKEMERLNKIPDDEKTEENKEDVVYYKKISRLMGEETGAFFRGLRNESALNKENIVVLRSPDECKEAVEFWTMVSNLYYTVAINIYDTEFKKAFLYDGAIYIDRIMKTRVSWRESWINSNGNVVNRETRYDISSRILSSLADMHKEMVELYCDLPEIKEKSSQLDNEMADIQAKGQKLTAKRDKIKEQLDKSVDELWDNNPEMKQQRNIRKAIPWLIVLVGVIFAVISYFTHIILYGILVLVIAIVVAIIFGGPVYKSFEKKVFPDEIKKLQADLEEAEEKCEKNDKTQTSKQNEIFKFDEEKSLRY